MRHSDHPPQPEFVGNLCNRHESAGKYRPRVNWRALAQGSETIVVYMGIHNLGTITAELLAAELSPETPVALIRWGTYPQQETLIGTLSTIVAQVVETGV
jgi:uroporphyrin-III C-methyltransferase